MVGSSQIIKHPFSLIIFRINEHVSGYPGCTNCPPYLRPQKDTISPPPRHKPTDWVVGDLFPVYIQRTKCLKDMTQSLHSDHQGNEFWRQKSYKQHQCTVIIRVPVKSQSSGVWADKRRWKRLSALRINSLRRGRKYGLFLQTNNPLPHHQKYKPNGKSRGVLNLS